MVRRLALALLVVGGLAGAAAAAIGAFNPAAFSPAATQAATGANTNQSLGTITLSTGTQAARPGARRRVVAFGKGFSATGGFGGPFGIIGKRMGGLTVTGVNGNTITATGRGGQTITVQVSATTAYTEAGASASLSDIHVGSKIAVKGTRTANNTVQASAVMIMLPSAAGVVTSISGSTLTLTGFNAVPHTVTVDTTTQYQRAGQTAALSDISVGSLIMAEGTTNSDGSLSARRIVIQLPHVLGQVTSVSGNSITVSSPDGTTYTVVTSSSTTYAAPGRATASASSITKGALIGAEGTLSADGKTLTALRVMVLPQPRAGRFGLRGGFGSPPMGGFGMKARGWFGQTPATTSPSTGSTQGV